MKKRILALFLSLAMVLSFVPFAAFAADGDTAAYIKVTEAPDDWSGDYLIVYEKSATSATVFDGKRTALDAEANHFAATIANGVIEANETTNAAKFTIAKSGTNYTIKSASGYFIGQTADGNKLLSSTSTAYTNTLSLETDGVKITASGKCVLRFNSATTSGNNRFRYYKSSTYTKQQAIQLYKYTELGEPDPDACQHENFTVVDAVEAETFKAGYSGDKVCDDCGETFEKGTVIPMLEYEADSTLTYAQATELALVFGHQEYSNNKYYLEGTVKSVTNTTYGNIYIEDAEGNTFYLYGLYKDSVRYDKMDPQPLVSDVIKVYGEVGNYSGSAQMRNAELIEHTVVAEPEEVEEPEDGSTITISEANQLGTDLNGKTSTGKFYVVGEITEVYQTSFGNMYIKDAEGNTLTVYGTYNADGTLKYGEMENAPVAGDTIKVYGAIGSYSGKSQMVNGWIVEQTECAHAETTLTGAIEAKCEVAGYTGDKVCDLCGRVAEKGTEIEALEHDSDVTLEAVAPKCEETGLTEGKACSKCGKVQKAQDVVDALEHNMVGDVIEPTADKSGYTDYVCANGCGKNYIADYTMPLDSEVKNVKADQITETMDLKVTWDAIDGADMYLVYVYDAEGTQVRGATVTNGNNTARINGFKVGTYTVKVRARVGGKYTAKYDGVEVTFGSILPEAPKATVVVTTKNSITVKWDEVKGAEAYFVEIVGGDQRFAPCTTDTTITWNGLKPNTEYKVSICVRLGATVYVGYGEQVTAKTKDYEDITITAEKTAEGILVAWDVDNADMQWVKRVDAEGNVTQIAVTAETSIIAKDVEGANTFYVISRVTDEYGIYRYVTSEVAVAQ